MAPSPPVGQAHLADTTFDVLVGPTAPGHAVSYSNALVQFELWLIDATGATLVDSVIPSGAVGAPAAWANFDGKVAAYTGYII